MYKVRKDQFGYLLSIIMLFILFVTGISDNFDTVIYLSILTLIMLIGIIFKLSINSKAIFIYTFVVCSMYVYIVNNLFTELNPNLKIFPYIFSDQLYFYNIGLIVLNKVQTIADLINLHAGWLCQVGSGECKQYAYVVLLTGIHKLSLSFFGSPASVISLKLINCFFAAIFVLNTYLILNYFFDEKESMLASRYFFLFSPAIFIAQALLRDMMIAAIFAIFLNILIRNDLKIKNIVILSILIFVIYLTRIQNGLVALLMLILSAYYELIVKLQRRFDSTLLISLKIFFIVAVAYISILYLYVYVSGFMLGYLQVSSANLNESSLTSIAYKLPVGLRNIALLITGILSPFPFYSLKFANNSFLYYLCLLPQKAYILFNINLFILNIVFICKKMWRNKIFNQKFLGVIIVSVLAILFSAVNFTPRRILCFYPILWVVAVHVINQIGRVKLYRVICTSTAAYMLLNLAYFILV